MDRSVRILDCTLRDGGYCNGWRFGRENIPRVIGNLSDAGIDIVECGFVTDKVKADPDVSKYPSVEEVSAVIPATNRNATYVAMINYGEFRSEDIPKHRSGLIDGLRIAFHKKDIVSALALCADVKAKGYKVFVQAMVSMAYTDREFLELIDSVNELKPYAFYIVDSFGMMRRGDLVRFYSLIEHNLDPAVVIGFHSHNNLQLAFSNSLALLEMRAGRDLIIDTSVYGMGRGAGNLNTELFVNHLNLEYGSGYDLRPILVIMDEVVNRFYLEKPWGYSLPNYLSAVHNAHPNYAGYFAERNTLTVEMMDRLFSSMDPERKVAYSKEYAEKVYSDFMSSGEVRLQHQEEFDSIVRGRTVLLVAPGRSSLTEKDRISSLAAQDGVVSIGVNSVYAHCPTAFTFVSNAIRFRQLPVDERARCITTSNIREGGSYLQVDYRSLLNDEGIVGDNAGLMAVRMCIMHGAEKVVLAGFDGYSYDALENYADGGKAFISEKAVIDATNEGMGKVLTRMSAEICIEFLTPPVHYSIG